MRNLIKLLILLFGVSIYGQDTLSVKDGAYGYDKDFVIDIDLKTETKIRALQFDLNWDGSDFNYLSSYNEGIGCINFFHYLLTNNELS